MAADGTLIPFEASHGPIVASWVRTLDEAASWASLAELPDAEVFERWHAEPGVCPYVLLGNKDPARTSGQAGGTLAHRSLA